MLSEIPAGNNLRFSDGPQTLNFVTTTTIYYVPRPFMYDFIELLSSPHLTDEKAEIQDRLAK